MKSSSQIQSKWCSANDDHSIIGIVLYIMPQEKLVSIEYSTLYISKLLGIIRSLTVTQKAVVNTQVWVRTFVEWRHMYIILTITIHKSLNFINFFLLNIVNELKNERITVTKLVHYYAKDTIQLSRITSVYVTL